MTVTAGSLLMACLFQAPIVESNHPFVNVHEKIRGGTA
jgi:hypothetical protein